MEKYSTVLQILAILIIFIFLYFLYRFYLTIKRKNRLKNFSINISNDKRVSTNILFQIVYLTSTVLESMVIFNTLASNYDRYTYQDQDIRKGMDYISIKILTGILLIFLYLFVVFLYRQNIELIIVCISFILGFIIPDFYCLYLESKNKRLVNKDMLKSIIIMNNSYKANRSTEQALNEVVSRVEGPIKIEFTKVLNDVRLGLSISESFKRMYERTNIKIVLEISHILKLMNQSGTNIIEIFDSLEARLLEEEKLETDLQIIDNTNILSFAVFLTLPVLFIFYLISMNDSYLKLIVSNRGVFVILTIAIMYILYIFVLWNIVKGVKKND